MASRVLGVLGWLARQVPTVLVLGGLVALWLWGASTGWKLDSRKPPDDDKGEKSSASLLEPGPVELSAESARLAGVEVEKAREQQVRHAIEAPAVLAFNQALYAHLAPRATGTAWDVLRSVGAGVKKGDVLALVSAPEVSKAKADFLSSYVQF